MGTIDSATIRLTCPSCGLTESDRILDKGHGWSGSHWQAPTFKKFKTQISGGATTDYEVTGTCPTCSVAADVTTQFGT